MVKSLLKLNIFVFFFGFSTPSLAGQTIMLTGGSGYIGSHVAVVLLDAGYDVVLVDNLANSEARVVDKIEQITKKHAKFYSYDLLDEQKLEEVFAAQKIDAVVHLAGFKAVGESVELPLKYYQNNLVSTLNLLRVMAKFDCHRLVFSSSATVYGAPKYLPIDENHPTGPTNPYGQTKLMIEKILEDAAFANPKSEFISLRYFNPVGAHESGMIGENPKGVPQNLLPYVLQVVQGKRPHVNVYGDDYDTKDGTGVRDYIHVMDLAEGHRFAIDALFKGGRTKRYDVYNLGTGTGYSVLEMVNSLSSTLGKDIPYVIGPRRPGDIASVFADASKAEKELGFRTQRSLQDMMVDSLRWLNTLSQSSKPSNDEL